MQKTALRAGFQHSGVSSNNRILERHPMVSRSGYFWTSYDFNSSSDDKVKLHDIFQHPFGPVGVFLPTKATAFTQNASESIFSLANNFQGYFVNGADGGRLDKAAVNIVIDPIRRDFAVTNGISCMSCHDGGINRATDEIKQAVTATGPLADTLTALAGLYPDPTDFNQLVAGDRSAFANAMRSAGLVPTDTYSDPSQRVNHGAATEMINALSLRLDVDLNLTEAASELGLTVGDFAKASSRDPIANQLYVTLNNSPDVPSVPRDRFQGVFTQIVGQMRTDTVIDVSKLAGVLPLPPVNLPPLNALLLTQMDVNSLAKISEVEASERPERFRVMLSSDRSEYAPNSPAKIYVTPSKACYVTLLSVDSSNKATILVPSATQPDNFVSPERPLRFPNPDENGTFSVSDHAGQVQRIVAICDPVESRPGLVDIAVMENDLATIKDFDLTMLAGPDSPNYDRPAKAIAGLMLKIK